MVMVENRHSDCVGVLEKMLLCIVLQNLPNPQLQIHCLNTHPKHTLHFHVFVFLHYFFSLLYENIDRYLCFILISKDTCVIRNIGD